MTEQSVFTDDVDEFYEDVVFGLSHDDKHLHPDSHYTTIYIALVVLAGISFVGPWVGDVLNFAWASNYVGCRLESNSVSLFSVAQWFTVPGSAATNQLTIPINSGMSNVFFRLVYP